MNTKSYQQQFGTLSAAGVGVVATRTREPFRCIDALREWAFTKDLPFALWNVRDGWIEQLPTDDPEKAPVKDGNVDPYKALMGILDVAGSGKNAKTKGVFVMHATHHWVSKSPGMIECLRHYVRDLAEVPRLRLVLIFPEGQNLPDDLKHDIPIIDFGLPNADERSKILSYIIESSTPDGEEVPDLFTKSQFEILVNSAGGMTEMETQTAFSKGIVLQRPDWPQINFEKYNGVVLDAKTEVIKQSEVLELMDSVPVEDVGGLEVYKEWIDTVSACLTPEAAAFGVDKPKGCVLIGAPGTGKSLVAKATASVLNQPLVKFDVSRIFASLVGQSEERARAAIKMLEAMAPCVALIDEIDKGLGGAHQGGGDSGVSKRVLGTILTAMQESTAPIFWIASANRVDSLPAELLRKGRFDEVFAVLTPNRVERESIFNIHLRKRKQSPDKITDLHVAVSAAKGYVGAEIEAAVKEAVKVAYVSGAPLTGALLAEQLGMMKPLRVAFPEDFARMESWAENNARKASLEIEEMDSSPEVAQDSGKPVRRRRSIG
jgi:AAA+ superfamily predicted ATPase